MAILAPPPRVQRSLTDRRQTRFFRDSITLFFPAFPATDRVTNRPPDRRTDARRAKRQMLNLIRTDVDHVPAFRRYTIGPSLSPLMGCVVTATQETTKQRKRNTDRGRRPTTESALQLQQRKRLGLIDHA